MNYRWGMVVEAKSPANEHRRLRNRNKITVEVFPKLIRQLHHPGVKLPVERKGIKQMRAVSG